MTVRATWAPAISVPSRSPSTSSTTIATTAQFSYCLKCINSQKSTDRQKLQLSCLNEQFITEIESKEGLSQLCVDKKAVVVIFYRQGTMTSQLLLD